MTHQTIHHFDPVFNFVIPSPDTETAEILSEALLLAKRRPDLLAAIATDQDIHGLKKKALRCADKAWAAGTPAIAGLEEQDPPREAGTLGWGRPRMDPLTVLLFLVLRGLNTSVTDQEAVERLLDSQTLLLYFQNRGIKRPGRSTILENINAVRQETRNLILDAQLETVRSEGWDDFAKITLDSTAVEADSAWPTDASLLCALLRRAGHGLRQLRIFGLAPVSLPWFDNRMRRVKALVFQIHNTHGNRAARRRNHLYRYLLEKAGAVIDQLQAERKVRQAELETLSLPPSRRQHLLAHWNGIGQDLHDADRVRDQARRRVLAGETIPNDEKIFSLADATAAMIVKGQREVILGYRPTIARSGNGFACALHLRQGNPADAGCLVPGIEQVLARTHTCPEMVITDDGFASQAGREQLQQMGVKRIVLSGAKGRKIMGEEEWSQPETAAARKDRSAVESLIFTLKYMFAFGRMRRRGLQQVHDEMLEKLIAHNFRCLVRLRAARRAAAAA